MCGYGKFLVIGPQTSPGILLNSSIPSFNPDKARHPSREGSY
jgi:hypothetical protein